MRPDPKPAARIVDPEALARARLSSDVCAACGAPPGSPHHIIPRSEGGDDVAGNLVLLCGNGTVRCHGALHGNPYVHRPAFGPPQRRDAGWVRVRIGAYIPSQRPDVVKYVRQKLGREAGDDYLARHYGYRPPEPVV